MTGVLAQVEYSIDGPLFLLVGSVLYGVMVVAMVLATVNILRKAGYSGWWSLVLLVPFVNMVMYVVFALADWPALRPGYDAEHQADPAYPSPSGERPSPRLT